MQGYLVLLLLNFFSNSTQWNYNLKFTIRNVTVLKAIMGFLETQPFYRLPDKFQLFCMTCLQFIKKLLKNHLSI